MYHTNLDGSTYTVILPNATLWSLRPTDAQHNIDREMQIPKEVIVTRLKRSNEPMTIWARLPPIVDAHKKRKYTDEKPSRQVGLETQRCNAHRKRIELQDMEAFCECQLDRM